MSTTQQTNDCGSIDNTSDESAEPATVFQNAEGRTIADGGDGDLAYISQLTAVAEYGIEAVAEADLVHHGLEAGDKVHINVGQWLYPLSRGEHGRLHANEEYDTDDGIPLLRPTASDDSGDQTVTESQRTDSTQSVTAG